MSAGESTPDRVVAEGPGWKMVRRASDLSTFVRCDSLEVAEAVKRVLFKGLTRSTAGEGTPAPAPVGASSDTPASVEQAARAAHEVADAMTDDGATCWHDCNTAARIGYARGHADAASAALMDLTKLAQALVDKLDAIENDGGMNGIFGFAQVHGIVYSGPNYGDEYRALKAHLSAQQPARIQR